MKRTTQSCRSFPAIWGAAIAAGIVPLAGTAPAAAQKPAVSEAPLTKLQADWKEWTEFREKTVDIEAKDPRAAIAKYQTFWEQRPKLDPMVSAQLCTVVAQIYHTGVKDDAAALRTCDWAIAQHKGSTVRIRPALYKAQLLSELKRTDEAQAFIEKSWSLMLISGPDFVRPMLGTYLNAAEQQLKGPAALDTIKGTFRRLPVYLGDETWSAGSAMYPAMIGYLTEKRQFEQASRWAKLRFMLCPYTPDSVTRAASSILAVSRASTVPLQSPGAANAPSATGPKGASGDTEKPGAPRVFGQMPPDTDHAPATEGSPSASLTVTLPPGFAAQLAALRTTSLPADALDRAVIKERLATVPRTSEQQRIERITLLLVSGAYRSAMDEALLYKKELPASPNGPKQIARVFKAVDLDVTRANAYLAFVKTGTGTNPVTAFLQQFPPDPAEAL